MPTGNQQQFSIGIRDWVRKAREQADRFGQQFAAELAKDLIRNTPGPGNSIAKTPRPGEPTGFLRGSWSASIGSPAPVQGKRDPSGTATLATMRSVSDNFRVGQVLYFTNSAPYAGFQEFGTSRTRPRAYVRMTLAAAPAIAQRVLSRLRARS